MAMLPAWFLATFPTRIRFTEQHKADVKPCSICNEHTSTYNYKQAGLQAAQSISIFRSEIRLRRLLQLYQFPNPRVPVPVYGAQRTSRKLRDKKRSPHGG